MFVYLFLHTSVFSYHFYIENDYVCLCMMRTTGFHFKKSVYVQHINMSNVICEARYA